MQQRLVTHVIAVGTCHLSPSSPCAVLTLVLMVQHEAEGADAVIRSLSRSARRFPRFIRVRDDKRPEDATGPDVICQLFRAQTRKMETAQEAVAARARGKGGPLAAAGAPVGKDGEPDDGADAEASSDEAGDVKVED